MEKVSEHPPLGQSIVRKAEEELLLLKEPESFLAIPGKGLKAQLDGQEIYIGNRKLMEEAGVSIEIGEDKLYKLEEEGKTAILVSINGGALSGIIGVADQIKDNSKEAIEELKTWDWKSI